MVTILAQERSLTPKLAIDLISQFGPHFNNYDSQCISRWLVPVGQLHLQYPDDPLLTELASSFDQLVYYLNVSVLND